MLVLATEPSHKAKAEEVAAVEAAEAAAAIAVVVHRRALVWTVDWAMLQSRSGGRSDDGLSNASTKSNGRSDDGIERARRASQPASRR